MYRSLILILALLLAACRQEKQAITYDGKAFEAHGWSGGMPRQGWPAAFAVYARGEPGVPPMAGVYKRRFGTIRFTPAFAPTAGVKLRAVFHRPDGEIASALFDGPKSSALGPPVSIQAIYPTTAEWPANQLKFYIEFSGPMTSGGAWDHIHLLDDKGKAVDAPFVETAELWSTDMKRLTVLFDPGRIKRGLGENMTSGPPLVPGRRYTLVIDKDWKTADGQVLTGEMRKPVTAVRDVRKAVEPSEWRMIAPTAPDAPLVIEFPRPMDHALALRVITVEGVAGAARLENEEKRWVFTPAAPWARGPYVLRIENILEDLAGNRLHRLFDMDTNSSTPAPATAPFDRVGFVVE